MKLNHPSRNWLLLSYTFLFVAITFFFFKEFYFHPNYFFNTAGDGMKNNSVYLYHVLHDTSWWHYGGMNYPYGENLNYIDGQPLLANLVKLLISWLPSQASNAQAIYNIFMFLTWWFGGIALLLLFLEMRIHGWFALCYALCIILMNPQINRLLGGHHGLSHPLAPWLFYGWFLIFKNPLKANLYLLIMSFLMIALAFLHLYQLAYGMLICGAFCIFQALQKSPLIDKLKSLFNSLVLLIIIPLVMVYLTMQFSDIHPDRPEAPSRFFMDHTTPWSVFLHPASKLGLGIYHAFNRQPDLNHEVHAYAGVLAIFFLLIFVVFLCLSWIPSKKYLWDTLSSFQKMVFGIALLALLLSMGLPFTIRGLNHLYYNTGIFRQVRSIGRFAVIFYFAIQIVGISWLHHQLAKINKFPIRTISYTIVLLIISIDTFGFLKLAQFNPQPIQFNPTTTLKYLPETNIPISDFQAIITNPLFNVGSENSIYFDKKDALRQSLQLSLETGLPLVNCMLTRNSLAQTIKNTQLAHPLFSIPAILAEFKNNRPLLLLESKGPLGKSNFSLESISKDAPVIFENDEIILKRLELSQFEKAHQLLNDSIKACYQIQKGATQNDAMILSYDESSGNKEIVSFQISDEYPRQVNLSVRFKTLNIGSQLIITQFDKNNNTIISFQEYTGNRIEQITEKETMILIPFELENQTSRIEISLKNIAFEIPFKINNALLFPNSYNYFQHLNNGWRYNNYDLDHDFNPTP